MKLYTEEQVIEAIRLSQKSVNIFSTPLMYDTNDVLIKLTPIELPSDEAIENNLPIRPHYIYKDGYIDGAKWIINQIKQKNQ